MTVSRKAIADVQAEEDRLIFQALDSIVLGPYCADESHGSTTWRLCSECTHHDCAVGSVLES